MCVCGRYSIFLKYYFVFSVKVEKDTRKIILDEEYEVFLTFCVLIMSLDVFTRV